ncbi:MULTISPECIES: ABC transporter permease [Haloferax]|uniref:ABC transporter permease subunit n=2 Tax=Haloferax TaxID=2251 RepID=A0A6G1Z4L1_9EURY|nr:MULTISPECIES: ABC transporter permease [Haloferax]KAB1188860.1 ABC transporter permease [Haloferax sp. CBA1149]MRW81577.1 ABC transporter permease subunit [Haloferax marinisediminis]
MSMHWYVARRVAWAVVATYLILTITFGLLAVAPGDGQTAFAFEAASEGGDVDEARETFDEITGRDEPLLTRYTNYMVNMATFNWGWSFTRNQTVMDALASAYPYSLMYAVPATLISIVFGYGIGLYSATHQYTLTDYLGTFTAFFGISIPNFWFGIMLILVFAVDLGWLPSYYQTGRGIWTLANAKQLVLPIIVLSTGAIAGNMRYSRAEALEYVHADFVKTARAKGADDWRVLVRHIFRPALVPLMTILVADILGLLFAGAYITEVVFQIPGLGLLSYRAIIQQDTALVMATTLVPVFIAIVGNLVQDIAYTVLDPRIDYGDR